MRVGEGVPVDLPDGTVVPSQVAAAKALGIALSTVKRHLARYGHLRQAQAKWEVRVEHNGICWLSQTALADALGLTVQTVIWHLNTHGNLDRLGKGKGSAGFRKDGPAVGRPRPFTFGPMSWESRADAAAELGIARRTLRRWSRPDARRVDREKLLRLVLEAHARREAAARRKAAA